MIWEGTQLFTDPNKGNSGIISMGYTDAKY